MSSTTEAQLPANVEPAPKQSKSLWQQAQDSIVIRDEKPYVIHPVTIKGEPLSETIVRERRGEF